MPEPELVICDDLDEAIDEHKARGFRLDMIFPADDPREALMSEPPPLGGGEKLENYTSSTRVHIVESSSPKPPADAGGSDWIVGRAGMEYRDLIPGRMDGKLIASHIRLTAGGDVPDYVHYHKIDFQMIYCKRGRIRVVYEDQGPPFWLETGDCVLQPPEIRHRVLYADAGAEVIEVSMPAEHETWVEHNMDLPNGTVDEARDFSGQRFVRHIDANAKWETDVLTGVRTRDTGISTATGGMAHVFVAEIEFNEELPPAHEGGEQIVLLFRLDSDQWLVVRIMKDKLSKH